MKRVALLMFLILAFFCALPIAQAKSSYGIDDLLGLPAQILDALGELTKGYEAQVNPGEIDLSNCEKSQPLNLTVHIPFLKRKVEVFIDGAKWCQIDSPILISMTKTCSFYINGAKAGTAGKETIKLNVLLRAEDGEERTEHVLLVVNHVQTSKEKEIQQEMDSLEFSINDIESKIKNYESQGYVMVTSREYFEVAKNETNIIKQEFENCELESAGLRIATAKPAIDAALAEATQQYQAQSKEKSNEMTGRIISTITGNWFVIVIVILFFVGFYVLKKLSVK